MKTIRKIIKTEEVSYSYPVNTEMDDGQESEIRKSETKALDNVSLDVEEGQFICILGSNGSGKSTLARHLNALLLPDKGSVWINDMTTGNDAFVWNIRSDVGMVFQNPDNQMVASQIDEEVAFGPENMGIPSPEIINRVNEALIQVGLQGRNKENPNNLSGGQKQRVAIASILAMKPKCIILDESTSMLDPRGRKEIMNTVKRLNREAGLTVICITHYMDEAVDADMIFVMNKGKIVLQGPPKTIFSHKEILDEAELKLPVICQIAAELKAKGMNIPEGIITAEELKRVLSEM